MRNRWGRRDGETLNPPWMSINVIKKNSKTYKHLTCRDGFCKSADATTELHVFILCGVQLFLQLFYIIPYNNTYIEQGISNDDMSHIYNKQIEHKLACINLLWNQVHSSGTKQASFFPKKLEEQALKWKKR